MAEFLNPFSCMIPTRKMTDSELVRALRLDLAAEEEAVHLYQAHADATDNELARFTGGISLTKNAFISVSFRGYSIFYSRMKSNFSLRE